MSDDKVDCISVNHNRHRSSPNGKYYTTRDYHRVSKQEEPKSRGYNGNSNKDFTSPPCQSDKVSLLSPEKFTQKDENNHKSFVPETPFRTQTNWKNIPYLPFPLPNNNYIPYPPNFNPIMSQFPPIFHQPSIPPLLHKQEANNPIFGNEYRRVNWENYEIPLNNQMREDTEVTMNMRSVVQKEVNLSEQMDIMKNVPEAMKVKKEDDSFISRVYLSKIDISEDLTQPDLYEQCTNVLDLDQESFSDGFDCKILFLEEGVEGDVSTGALLFAAINNSVFKKAMSLYTKQRTKNEEKDVDEVANGGCLLVLNSKANISRIHHHSFESTH